MTQIVIYETVDPACPPGSRFLARFRINSGPKGALEWSVAYMVGAERADLETRAATWMADELAKAAPKPPKAKKATPAPQPTPPADDGLGDIV